MFLKKRVNMNYKEILEKIEANLEGSAHLNELAENTTLQYYICAQQLFQLISSLNILTLKP